MWRWLVIPLLAYPLHADLRLVVQQTYGSSTNVETDWYRDQLSRSDSNRGSYIFDKARGTVTVLDATRREYYEARGRVTSLRQLDRSTAIVIECDTRDTGETRDVWGHTAHRYITVKRQRTESAASGSTPWQETTIDSWFLDVPVPASYIPRSPAQGVFSALTLNGSMPDFRITRKGVKPTGLLIYEKSDGSVYEVTDLSESPLDPKLFELPADYRRVIRPMPGARLTWDEQILYYWQQFQDWFANLIL